MQYRRWFFWSPILSTKNNKVIGYHLGYCIDDEFNKGIIIINSIIDFNKQYNYLFNIENDINKTEILNYSNSSDFSNSSGIDNDKNNNNKIALCPELDNVISQKILLLSLSSFKNHPRTVYFLNELNSEKNKLG